MGQERWAIEAAASAVQCRDIIAHKGLRFSWKSDFFFGSNLAENRDTLAEIDSTGVGAVDVARGGIHPAAQRYYAPSDAALYHVRQARQAGRTSAPSMSPQESAAFNQANQHFADSHMTGHAPADQPQGDVAHHGWSPQARIAAARARGAQKLPYGGDPTQAPDYVPPKGKAR